MNIKYDGMLECQVKDIFKQTAEAIKYIHESGYIHCDLKPDNVLIGDDMDYDIQELKLADFGMVQRKNYMLMSQKSNYEESCEETKCNNVDIEFEAFDNDQISST